MAIDRRSFLKLAGYGGVVFSTGLAGVTRAWARGEGHDEFLFVQLSDTHWGFNNAKWNADARGTLPKAVATVNALERQPDFVVFTGDLTHTTDDARERRARLKEFQDIVGNLKCPNVRLIPGEHDASLDDGEAYKEIFGPSYYTFEHKGIHFIALDNVSDPRGRLGEKQVAWLRAGLQRQAKDARIVVLTHRPLFDLAPQWGWATGDGAQAMELLMPFEHATVFYGHIHQEHHHNTGHIAHHSAKSLIFPLSAPGSGPKKHKIAWDAARPYQGLGLRGVAAPASGNGSFSLSELSVKGG